jgi:hypothetical protein
MEGLGRSAQCVANRGLEVRTEVLDSVGTLSILALQLDALLLEPRKFGSSGGAVAVMRQQDCDPPR